MTAGETLSPRVAKMLAGARQSLQKGSLADATRAMSGVLALAPDHPDVLRTQGALELARGEFAAAATTLEVASERLVPDVELLDQLARAQAGRGDNDTAFAAWRRATVEFPDSALAWFNLGSQLNAAARIGDAVEPLQRCVELAPDNRVSRVMLGDVLAQLGRTEEAAAQYRAVLRSRPDTGHAWWGLANLKTLRFSETDVAKMKAVKQRDDLPDQHRALLGFALGTAQEQAGDYAAAFASFGDANARMRRTTPWNAAAFGNAIRRVRTAFDSLPPGAMRSNDLGREVIFVTSLPRSGSTLVEQILAAHSEVEGAGELADIEAVIRGESTRRRMDFPDWVAAASQNDWKRLGEAYLARTARWRTRRPRHVDKLPGNWVFVGAIRAMLPGAHVIDVYRDPVETGWSCFKQAFAKGNAFSYDLADIADYSKGHDETLRLWQRLHPHHVRKQSLAALIAEPEAQIRASLEFLGLPFEDSCLQFHQVDRAVRTPSAAQVHEPLRAVSPRAGLYGELLAPLRNAFRSID